MMKNEVATFVENFCKNLGLIYKYIGGGYSVFNKPKKKFYVGKDVLDYQFEVKEFTSVEKKLDESGDIYHEEKEYVTVTIFSKHTKKRDFRFMKKEFLENPQILANIFDMIYETN